MSRSHCDSLMELASFGSIGRALEGQMRPPFILISYTLCTYELFSGRYIVTSVEDSSSFRPRLMSLYSRKVAVIDLFTASRRVVYISLK